MVNQEDRKQALEAMPKGQMRWGINGENRELEILHGNTWVAVSDHPQLSQINVPTPPRFSKGYGLFLALTKLGWEVVPVSRTS